MIRINVEKYVLSYFSCVRAEMGGYIQHIHKFLLTTAACLSVVHRLMKRWSKVSWTI
jgi:hypothetical protein